jgi:hypothetical protein
MFLAIDLSLFFNQYINPIALARLTWKYYIFYDVWLLFELFVVWRFYLETRNTPLEEIVKHFDGEGAILGGTAATEKSRQLAEEIDRAAPLPIGMSYPALSFTFESRANFLQKALPR